MQCEACGQQLPHAEPDGDEVVGPDAAAELADAAVAVAAEETEQRQIAEDGTTEQTRIREEAETERRRIEADAAVELAQIEADARVDTAEAEAAEAAAEADEMEALVEVVEGLSEDEEPPGDEPEDAPAEEPEEEPGEEAHADEPTAVVVPPQIHEDEPGRARSSTTVSAFRRRRMHR
jgi:hypothetical protein